MGAFIRAAARDFVHGLGPEKPVRRRGRRRDEVGSTEPRRSRTSSHRGFVTPHETGVVARNVDDQRLRPPEGVVSGWNWWIS